MPNTSTLTTKANAAIKGRHDMLLEFAVQAVMYTGFRRRENDPVADIREAVEYLAATNTADFRNMAKLHIDHVPEMMSKRDREAMAVDWVIIDICGIVSHNRNKMKAAALAAKG